VVIPHPRDRGLAPAQMRAWDRDPVRTGRERRPVQDEPEARKPLGLSNSIGMDRLGDFNEGE
jgi:hypothetical protein